MGWKILHKLFQYQFLMIFLATGVSFMSLSQNWELYGTPLREVAHLFGEDFVHAQGSASDITGEGAPGNGNEDASNLVENVFADAAWEPGEGTVPGMPGEERPGGEMPERDRPGGAQSAAENGENSGMSAQGKGDDFEMPSQGNGEGSGMPSRGNAEGSELPNQGSLEGSGLPPQGDTDQGEISNAVQPTAPEKKEFQTVDETYFEDALFIGDSRTVGLRDYGKLGDGPTFYASTGLTVFKLFTAEIVEQEGTRKKTTVEDALGQKQFQKIYLMVGINELGTGDVERFEKTYREVVERIRELQPNAIIYIQSILKVTEKRSQQGDYITNQGIIDRNEAIKKIADDQTIFYLDVNRAVCDESGNLIPEYTGDGVHITAKYMYLWKDYLMSHAIEM